MGQRVGAIRRAAEPPAQLVLTLQLQLAHAIRARLDLEQFIEALLVRRECDPAPLQLGGQVPVRLRPTVRKLDAGELDRGLEAAVVLLDTEAGLPQPIADSGAEPECTGTWARRGIALRPRSTGWNSTRPSSRTAWPRCGLAAPQPCFGTCFGDCRVTSGPEWS